MYKLLHKHHLSNHYLTQSCCLFFPALTSNQHKVVHKLLARSTSVKWHTLSERVTHSSKAAKKPETEEEDNDYVLDEDNEDMPKSPPVPKDESAKSSACQPVRKAQVKTEVKEPA